MAEIVAEGRFGRHLFAAMADNNVDIRETAKRVDSTYEHIRKLVKGLANPSPYMLIKLSKALKGFNQNEAHKLVDLDKAQKKFKGNFNEMAGIPEDADAFLKDWAYLTPNQKEMLTIQVSAIAMQNRGSTAPAKTARAKIQGREGRSY